VINERTGTVIIGNDVRISTCAVSHGDLSIKITVREEVAPSAEEAKREVVVREEEQRLTIVPEGVSLGEVVKALNAIGVSPRDLIIILQAMKVAGALRAEIEIM
jgi:flagellar P-ring protein precursor FlgI